MSAIDRVRQLAAQPHTLTGVYSLSTIDASNGDILEADVGRPVHAYLIDRACQR